MKRAKEQGESARFVPAAQAALAFGQTREVIIRRVLTRAIRGKLENGRWYVDASELPKDAPRAEV